MEVKKLNELGYAEAVYGFSLSYRTTTERAMEILPKYAFGVPGESKFLESIVTWWDVVAPRYWWQEADTYRVGTTKQSESTMHTLMKKDLEQTNFELGIEPVYLEYLNSLIKAYKVVPTESKKKYLHILKNALPEGFLQRRIWMISYAGLKNIYNQRKNHRLPEWNQFLTIVLAQVEHPEFIKQGIENG